jgi:putative hydrolase of the HAD superfamily
VTVPGFAAGVEIVGVDGDDTLWLCQQYFDDALTRLCALLADDADSAAVEKTLEEVESGNLGMYGYGIKSFTLSMLDVGLRLTGNTLRGRQTRAIIDIGREMLTHPVELLPGAESAVRALAASHRVVLVTKGDLVDQQRKLRASGLREHFEHVEIVAEKDPASYAELLAALECKAEDFLMVGNSAASDVVPVLSLGGWAIHVPHRRTWTRELVPDLAADPRLLTLGALTEVPGVLQGGR